MYTSEHFDDNYIDMYDDGTNSYSLQMLCLLCAPTVALGCQELWLSQESEKHPFMGCFNVSIASQTSGYCTFLSISSTAITPSMPITVLFTETTDLVATSSSTEYFSSCSQAEVHEATHYIPTSALASVPGSRMTLTQTTSQLVLDKSPTPSTIPSSNVAVWGVVMGVVTFITAMALVLAITVSTVVKRSKPIVHNLE